MNINFMNMNIILYEYYGYLVIWSWILMRIFYKLYTYSSKRTGVWFSIQQRCYDFLAMFFNTIIYMFYTFRPTLMFITQLSWYRTNPN